jgi:hypothetical protein
VVKPFQSGYGKCLTVAVHAVSPTVVEKTMRIVTLPWIRHGTDDILVRFMQKGCPEHLPDILIPMGA